MQIIFEHFKSTKPCFRVVGVFSCRCRSNLFGWVTVFAQSFILQQQKSHKNILLPMSPVTDVERMRIIGKGLNERTRIHPKGEWPQWKDIGREENIGKSVNEHFTLISSPSGETNPLPNWMMCDKRNGRKRRLCVGTSKCIKNRHVVLLEQLSPYHNWYQL